MRSSHRSFTLYLALILVLFLSLSSSSRSNSFVSAQDDGDDSSSSTSISTSASISDRDFDDSEILLPEGAPAADLTESEAAEVAKGGEKLEFQAEVTRLMDIIINSLYSKREIFMRELISNAADALDKVRFLTLTNQTTLGSTPQLDIKIAYDREANTISITDTGVGMTREDLIKNLGVVAKSGTSDFLEAAAKGADALSLIGQFGVGFYSIYLVADRVTVVSKHTSPDSEQHIWESTADKTFTVSKDPRGNTLGRGTQVILHMKEDAKEFVNEHEIKKLVARYSEFINYPIYLYLSKRVAPDEDPAAPPKPRETDTVDGIELTEEEADPQPNTSPTLDLVEKFYWSRLNDVKAIWTRSPSDITDSEYAAFYKTLTKDEKEPLVHIHFKAEGEITFRSILFIPSHPPQGMYDKFYEKSTALKLYVRRVLISDEFDDFLPRYLNFVRGVVDSEDLPLNVSRETLAQSRVLRVMAKKITRKVLEMIRKMSDHDKTIRAKKHEKTGDKQEEQEEVNDFTTFWSNYGKAVKLGMIDDRGNKPKLSKFLRFTTSKSNGEFISLDEYVERMKANQRFIFYITGESDEAVKQSPFVEKLIQKDLEVVYMTDPVDEYLLQTMTEYDGTQLASVTKEGLNIDDAEEQRAKVYADEFKPLTQWLQSALGERVTKVTVSSRVATSPMVIVTGQYGWSSNMERIMSGQTFANAKDTAHLRSKRTLEINPRHPIIRELKARVEAGESQADLSSTVDLLYDAALLQSGFLHENPAEFAKRIHRVTAKSLSVDPDAPLAGEIEVSSDSSESSSSSGADDLDDMLHEEL